MAERSNAAVLKTVDLHGSGGSNPSLSAKEMEKSSVLLDFSLFFPGSSTLSASMKLSWSSGIFGFFGLFA